MKIEKKILRVGALAQANVRPSSVLKMKNCFEKGVL